MKQLTDKEKEVLQTLLDKHIYASPLDIEASFRAGLALGVPEGADVQQAQLAALTAERDALRAEVERMRGKLIDLYTGEYIVLNQLSMAIFGKQIDTDTKQEIHKLISAHWEAKKARRNLGETE